MMLPNGTKNGENKEVKAHNTPNALDDPNPVAATEKPEHTGDNHNDEKRAHHYYLIFNQQEKPDGDGNENVLPAVIRSHQNIFLPQCRNLFGRIAPIRDRDYQITLVEKHGTSCISGEVNVHYESDIYDDDDVHDDDSCENVIVRGSPKSYHLNEPQYFRQSLTQKRSRIELMRVLPQLKCSSVYLSDEDKDTQTTYIVDEKESSFMESVSGEDPVEKPAKEQEMQLVVKDSGTRLLQKCVVEEPPPPVNCFQVAVFKPQESQIVTLIRLLLLHRSNAFENGGLKFDAVVKQEPANSFDNDQVEIQQTIEVEDVVNETTVPTIMEITEEEEKNSFVCETNILYKIEPERNVGCFAWLKRSRKQPRRRQ